MNTNAGDEERVTKTPTKIQCFYFYLSFFFKTFELDDVCEVMNEPLSVHRSSSHCCTSALYDHIFLVNFVDV